MKRVICISVLSAFIFSLLLAFSIIWLHSAQWQLQWLNDGKVDEANIDTITEVTYTTLRNGLLFLLGSICTLTLYIVFALKEFKVFQPLVDKFNSKISAYKDKRKSTKQAKSEAEKQKRIQDLQAELDALKDETKS